MYVKKGDPVRMRGGSEGGRNVKLTFANFLPTSPPPPHLSSAKHGKLPAFSFFRAKLGSEVEKKEKMKKKTKWKVVWQLKDGWVQKLANKRAKDPFALCDYTIWSQSYERLVNFDFKKELGPLKIY